MTRRMLGVMIAMFAFIAPAAAQSRDVGALPPDEILGIVRDGGFDPLGQPVRRGPNYVLRAVDDTDREVSVVVNARSGDILSVTPVRTASRITPSGSTGPRMAPGYVPPGAYRGAPMIIEDDEPVYRRPPAPIPNAPPGYSARPQTPGAAPGYVARPPQAEDDDGPSPNDTRAIRPSKIPPPAGGQDGLLPPPPERFPQRAAPAAPPKPKPVQRAAAAPPKSTPLPKPRPSNAETPPPAVRSTPIPPPAPEQPPAAEETPH